MVDSRIFLKKSIKKTSKSTTRARVSIMNTDLSMIWLLKSSRVTEVSYGLARTTMVMSNQI